MNLVGSSAAGCLNQYPFHRPTAAHVFQELSTVLESQQHIKEKDSLAKSIISRRGIAAGYSGKNCGELIYL